MKQHLRLCAFTVLQLFAFANATPEVLSTPSHTIGAKIPDGIPVIENPLVFTTFEFFWGKMRSFGTEYAESQSNVALNTGGVQSSYKHYYQDFDWGPGFTLGVGRNFEAQEWDVYFNFLYFQKGQGSEADGGTGGNIVISRVNPSVPNNNSAFSFAQNANSTFTTEMYNYVLELGKTFYVNKWTSIRASIGGMFADLRQSQAIQYNGVKATLTSAPLDAFFRSDATTSFYGIGPRAGMNLTYYFKPSWYFFSNGSGALLSGHYKVQMTQTFSSNDSKFIDTANFQQLVPETELNFGLGYGGFFADEKIYLALRIGYDIQYWWNQYIRYDMTGTLNELDYDLSLQRYFINLMIDF